MIDPVTRLLSIADELMKRRGVKEATALRLAVQCLAYEGSMWVAAAIRDHLSKEEGK